MTLWASHFGREENSDELFLRRDDVPVVDGKVTVKVVSNWAYTLSTIRTASKAGEAQVAGMGVVESPLPPPPPKMGAFPSMFQSDFNECMPSSIPKFVAPMAGAFECVAVAGQGKMAVRQLSPTMSICDRGDVTPYAVIGDGFRTEYDMSMDILLPSTAKQQQQQQQQEYAGAFIGARTKGPVGSGVGMDGVFLVVNASHWYIALNVSAAAEGESIAMGKLPHSDSLKLDNNDAWRRLRLIVSGTTATASVDGTVVASGIRVPPPRDHFTGQVAGVAVNLGKGGYASFGTVGYVDATFDNLSIRST